MMRFFRLAGSDLRRAIFQGRFFLSVLLIVLILWISTVGFMDFDDSSAMYLLSLSLAGTGNAQLILCLIAILPFAMAYGEEYEGNAVQYIIFRGDLDSYLWARVISVFLSSFLCVCTALCIYTGAVMLKGFDFSNAISFCTDDSYGILYNSGHPGLYFICILEDRSLTGGLMAVCCFCVSVYFRERLAAFCTPVCLYFLALRVLNIPPELMDRYHDYKVAYWVEDTCHMGGSGLACLFWKTVVTAAFLILYGMIAGYGLKRRWKNGKK